jgi:hypothetical protein
VAIAAQHRYSLVEFEQIAIVLQVVVNRSVIALQHSKILIIVITAMQGAKTYGIPVALASRAVASPILLTS